MELIDLVQRGFAGRKILVVGDAVADQFLSGTISRVSREAPVFILRHDETVTLPGAAANAAANIAALGADVKLAAVVGQDPNAGALLNVLEAAHVDTSCVVAWPGLTTTTKVRVLAAQHYSPRQQVIRIDYEPSGEIASDLADDVSAKVLSAIAWADAIVISDYGYGVVTPGIFEMVKGYALERQIPLVLDSRYRLSEFTGATSATPNREEVSSIVGAPCDDAKCEALRERLGLPALLMTNGNEGMTLFEEGASPIRMPAVGPKEPVDVTGAGDTVIAVYALGLAAGLSFHDAARLANHAGGIVVMKRGTATTTVSELLDSLRSSASIGAV